MRQITPLLALALTATCASALDTAVPYRHLRDYSLQREVQDDVGIAIVTSTAGLATLRDKHRVPARLSFPEDSWAKEMLIFAFSDALRPLTVDTFQRQPDTPEGWFRLDLKWTGEHVDKGGPQVGKKWSNVVVIALPRGIRLREVTIRAPKVALIQRFE